MNHKILVNGRTVTFRSFSFPAGEIGVQVEPNQYWFLERGDKVISFIICPKNSGDVFQIALLKDAISRFKNRNDKVTFNLILTYLPYARQDRVCNRGESFSLKVFADFINSLKFDSVTLVDPHSDVALGVFDNCKVIERKDILHKYVDFSEEALDPSSVFVSPDAGANKKTFDLCAYYQKEFIRADKLRDLATGNIKETIVYADSLVGRQAIICDDICDGGRTFIELAKVLKAKGAEKVILYVTHGIFSQGIQKLIDGGIDMVYTTNSYYDNDCPNPSIVNVFNLNNLF